VKEKFNFVGSLLFTPFLENAFVCFGDDFGGNDMSTRIYRFTDIYLGAIGLIAGEKSVFACFLSICC
jgi:hypothetical protein